MGGDYPNYGGRFAIVRDSLLSTYYMLGSEGTSGNVKEETNLGEILKGC